MFSNFSSSNQTSTGLTNKFNFNKSSEPNPEANKTPSDTGNKNSVTTPPINFDEIVKDDQVKDEKFQKAVSKLNHKFVKSVQDFVRGNECVDLQPCFDSYNKHFEKIVECYATESVLDKLQANGVREFKHLGVNRKKVVEEESKKAKPESKPFKFNGDSGQEKKEEPKAPTFNFGASTSKTSSGQSSAPFTFGGASGKSDEPKKPAPFTFGGNSETKDESKTNAPFQFSFAGGQLSSNSISNSMFSSKPSTVQNPPQTKPAEPAKKAEEGQPSDTVPEIEDKQFKEEGVVFEIRCKLYYKYDGAYKERGVGTLFVKKDETDGKASVLVRAENHQGTILLNSSLTKGMPQPNLNGTKNILLTCIVSPEIPKVEELTGKLNLFLVKVKTEDQANELLESIKQFI